MKTNKLKLLPLAICCMVIALCSETQGMDNRPDILESSTANAIVRMHLSARYESDVGSIMSDSISPDLAKLKHTQTSWASYLLSPAKSVIHATYDVITSANTHHVYSALIMGMIFASEFAMVSAVKMPTSDCVLKCQEQSNGGWGQVLVHPVVWGAAQLAKCIAICAAGK